MAAVCEWPVVAHLRRPGYVWKRSKNGPKPFGWNAPTSAIQSTLKPDYAWRSLMAPTGENDQMRLAAYLLALGTDLALWVWMAWSMIRLWKHWRLMTDHATPKATLFVRLFPFWFFLDSMLSAQGIGERRIVFRNLMHFAIGFVGMGFVFGTIWFLETYKLIPPPGS